MPKSWTIGSRPECSVVVDVPRVSGQHCRLVEEAGRFFLEDLGSTNGTYVNGVRITERVPIGQTDRVTLGQTTPMPWPADAVGPAQAVLRLGREADNDLVVDLPTVSGHHARIVWDGERGQAWVEDLGSSNGTALGSPDRKIDRAPLTAADTIYLGSHPLPGSLVLARIAPGLAPSLCLRGTEMVVGRDPACDCVLEFPMISGRHARMFRSGKEIRIEDLGSANGTFLNGQRIEGPVAVAAGDLVGLGSYTLVLNVDPVPGTDTPAPLAAGRAQEPSGLAQELARLLDPPWRPAALLVQAPVLAIAIARGADVAVAPPASPEGWTALAETVAGLAFRLSLAAVWFGLSSAGLSNLLDVAAIRNGLERGVSRTLLYRLGLLAALATAQCVVAWGIVATVAGLRSPALPALGLMLLAAGVGAALGGLLRAASPRPALAWAAVPVVILLLGLFGGVRLAPAGPAPAPWARLVSSALPTRWAFEGLLLLESAHHPKAAGSEPAGDGDLAERYFPADSERMGPTADATALALMLVGLASSTAFIARAPRPAWAEA